jgi:hypothetical protein
MKVTVSFTTNLFQHRDISERLELIPSVFKGNVSELELDNINVQNILITENKSESQRPLKFKANCYSTILMLKTLIYEGANRIKVLVTDFVT